MVSVFKYILVLWSVVFFSGCAGFEALQEPPISPSTATYQLKLTSKLIPNNALSAFVNEEENIIYYTDSGKGKDAAAIFLLGGIGVLASQAAKQSKSTREADQLADSMLFEPKLIIEEIITNKEQRLILGEDGSAYSITPYLHIKSVDENKIAMAAAVVIEEQVSDSKAWYGIYVHETDSRYNIDDLSGAPDEQFIHKLGQELSDGYREVLNLYLSMPTTNLAKEEPVKFKTDIIPDGRSNYMKAEMVSCSVGRVCLKTENAVYSIKPENIEYDD